MKSFVTVICLLIFINISLSAQSQWQDYPIRSSKSESILDKLKDHKIEVKYDSTKLDSFILATMNTYHIPGVQACIVKNDQIIWKGAYGYANIAQNRLVTDSTLFLLASISKTITATAIMQVWEEGLFGLDDDVNNYLNFSVRNPYHSSIPITFRMLLTHTSGITGYRDFLTFGGDSPIELGFYLENYLTPGGLYYNSQNWSNSTPGTLYDYSNEGTALLGYLVEEICATSFEQYCQDSIFIPLGMNETSWFLANLDTNNIAIPYKWNGIHIPYQHYGWPDYPAAQLRTSAIQLSRFLRAYIQHGQIDGVRILDSATVDLITTKHLFVNDPTSPFWQGFIWRIFNYDIPYLSNELYCGHTGGGYGCRASIDYMLENPEKLGVIVLTNGESWEGLYIIGDEIYIYGYLLNKIYAQNVSLNSAFMQANVDTLILNTEFVNHNSHNFSANAIFTSVDSSYIDSIALYDDGNHGDLHAGDGIWGNYILPISDENEFIVDISTVDLDLGGYFKLNDLTRFTTIGPVILEEYRIISSDTIANHGDNLRFQFTLKNSDSVSTAETVTALIVSLDTCATISSPIILVYGNIGPTQCVTSNRIQYIKFPLNCPDSIYAHFRIDIYSDEHLFWTDTFSVFVHKDPTKIEKHDENTPIEFVLKQNYPNPFNPSTTIEFTLPKSEFVELKVYNILGKEVSTPVSKKLNQGNHTYTFDGKSLASGIYYYQLVAGDYREVKKMILLK